MNLGAIQCDVAELEQLHLARQHQHLHEQCLDFLQKPPPEGGQRVMVRMGVGRHKAKRDRVIGGAFNLAARMHAAGVAVDQQAQQDSRVVGGRATSCVLAREIVKIQALNHFDDEACQMVIGQPLVHRWR